MSQRGFQFAGRACNESRKGFEKKGMGSDHGHDCELKGWLCSVTGPI